MTLPERLEQIKAQFDQAKANANFLAGQVALLEVLIAEEGSEPVNARPNGPINDAAE